MQKVRVCTVMCIIIIWLVWIGKDIYNPGGFQRAYLLRIFLLLIKKIINNVKKLITEIEDLLVE